jgi:hypothetical protein
LKFGFHGLSLFIGNRLSAIDVLVLGLGGCRIEFAQIFLGSGNVVPAAVLEIDQRLVVVIDRDDTSNEADDSRFRASLRRLAGSTTLSPKSM